MTEWYGGNMMGDSSENILSWGSSLFFSSISFFFQRTRGQFKQSFVLIVTDLKSVSLMSVSAAMSPGQGGGQPQLQHHILGQHECQPHLPGRTPKTFEKTQHSDYPRLFLWGILSINFEGKKIWSGKIGFLAFLRSTHILKFKKTIFYQKRFILT